MRAALFAAYEDVPDTADGHPSGTGFETLMAPAPLGVGRPWSAGSKGQGLHRGPDGPSVVLDGDDGARLEVVPVQVAEGDGAAEPG